jgi:hypothetical protein
MPPKLQQQKSTKAKPDSRFQSLGFKILFLTDTHRTRGYGLKVKAEDIRSRMAATKANVKPGNFVPFHLRATNAISFKKAVEYMNIKNKTVWDFIVNYVSEGIF